MKYKLVGNKDHMHEAISVCEAGTFDEAVNFFAAKKWLTPETLLCIYVVEECSDCKRNE